MPVLGAEAIAALGYEAGWIDVESLTVAVAIALAESAGDTDAHNFNPQTLDDSYGLWQINMLGDLGEDRAEHYQLDRYDQLLDPRLNAHVAYDISRGGTFWEPWSVYRNGRYRTHLAVAGTAAQSVIGRGGTPDSDPLAPVFVPSTSPDVRPELPAFDETPADVAPVIGGFTIGGRPIETIGALDRLAVGGRVDLSAEQVSQVELEFLDARRASLTFGIGAEVDYADLRLTVAGRAFRDFDGVELFAATMRDRSTVALRDPGRETRMWSDTSATEVAAQLAAENGLLFVGKGTARRQQIVAQGLDGPPRDAESAWTLLDRLAREEGHWLFVSGRVLYFAPPSWIADGAIRFPARWDPDVVGDWHTLMEGPPEVDVAQDAYPDFATRLARSITFRLPRWRGERVRPGMVAVVDGIPGFDQRPMLVTNVSWELDGGITPVTVDALEPVDPVAEDPGGLQGLETADSGTVTATDPPLGSGTAGGTAGPYGYQYDPVGTACSGREQPGARALQNHILRTFGGSDWGIYNCRNVAGTSTLSVHGEGRAGDTGCSVALGQRIAAWLVDNAPMLGIQQVIHNRQDWNSRRRTWDPYGGAHPHTDHVHWELCHAAAAGLTEAYLAGAPAAA